jgi:hypothetical protein
LALLHRIILLGRLRLLEGVLSQPLDDHYDLFDWLDNNTLGVVREN